jgi:hypothetical protein
MREFTNFFGGKEGIPEEIYKIVATAPIVASLSFIDERSGKKVSEGLIEIRQRGTACLALNSYEPRSFIVCWDGGNGCTDITFHSTVGGEHGALHAMRLMFERYAGKEL